MSLLESKRGVTMSQQSPKRRKTMDQREATATATAGVPATGSLPTELLETICGFLDVRTLCTARLACTEFRGVASRRLHFVKLSVDELRSRPETTLNNFPNLSRVTLYDVGKADLPMLAQSPVADAVTHLEAAEYLTLVPRRARTGACSPLPPFPNLVSLTVSYDHGCASELPQTLRELTLESPLTERTASLVTQLTGLTCLRIDIRTMREPFQAVTALTALQRLEISSDLSFAPFAARLTLLTHLQFRETDATPLWGPPWPPGVALACLTTLHNLVHLGVGKISRSLEYQLLATLQRFTSLRSLELGLRRTPEPSEFDTIPKPPFTQLTALRLESGLLDASILPKLNLDRLQELSLSHRVRVGQEGVAALRRATGLTQLRVWTQGFSGLSPGDLGTALSRMPRLRALSVCSVAKKEPFCFEAIGLLTELTELKCEGGRVSDADVEACLGLRKLRVLSIVPGTFSRARSNGVTREFLVAIAKLPELTKFRTAKRFWSNRLGLGDDIPAWLDAERQEKGWPPLELVVLR